MRMGTVETVVTAMTSRRTEWLEAEFHAFFRQHYGVIVGIVARLVGEKALAEEITDDAFWKLYCRPELAQASNNAPGWLYRTASRMAIDALRARRRGWDRQERMAHEPGEQGTLNPLELLERGERVAEVQRALARLRPVQAQMLVLRHGGLSYAEVATALGMKASSVGTTLARAEAAFARAYEEGR